MKPTPMAMELATGLDGAAAQDAAEKGVELVPAGALEGATAKATEVSNEEDY